jgi:hypothetical protein
MPLSRRSLLASIPLAAAQSKRRAVELTFLKSLPGQRENLKRFITLNWFALDATAVSRGLMHSYKILDSGSDDGPWNLLVSVTYNDERGYEGIREAFELIRKSHKAIPVESKTLPDLGSIVNSTKLYENTDH